MALIGLLFLLTGVIMSLRVSFGPLRRLLTPAEIMRTTPWLISAGLTAIGVVLIVVATH